MADEIKFDDLPESKETPFIKEPGIHLKFSLDDVEFVDSKVVPATKKVPEKVTNAYAKFNFKSETHVHSHFLFCPPMKEEDVKYFSDLYEKGIKVRKKTAEEMIRQEFNERFYFYEQLARAWNTIPDKLISFKKQSGGSIEGMFKRMFEKFFDIYDKNYWKDKKINMKLMWNNNEKAHTSFLQLCRPEANNIIFAPYLDDKTPVLQLNAYEEKNQVRKFKPQDRAPVNDNGDAGPADDESNWKPATEQELKKPDLF